MTFFEQELHRLFDDSERISADAVFAGKTMIAPIGEDLRAKVQFIYSNYVNYAGAKRVDVYDQIMLNWDAFVNYVWEHKGVKL